jgi:uncharacterized protein YdiU (UPF0061 family)
MRLRGMTRTRISTGPQLSGYSRVIERQARLIARWMGVGFIHGVMNTDNCTISGETIDYGPCAFMDGYNPAQVYSSIDQQGRYAFANQPPHCPLEHGRAGASPAAGDR